MTRSKILKIATLFGLIIMAAVAATAVTAKTPSTAQMPEYVGSQTCVGCHAEKVAAWENSLHHTSFQLLDNPDAFPGDIKTVPAELKAELDKADYVWRGKRFLAQDHATGELRYLNVQFNTTTKQYETYKGGSAWSQTCGGCHSTAVNSQTHASTFQAGISCESCHGPGRDHVLGKGDPSKIVNSTEPSKTCAQCHSGDNTIQGSTRFAKGYRPGTAIEDFEGFEPPVYEPGSEPPHMEDHHMQQYPQWKASGHANATNLLIEHGPTYPARAECIKCHSTSAGFDIAEGKTWNPDTMLVNDGVSCAACHDSHGSEFQASLKMEPQALCVSCHSVGRGNPAPVKIGTTRAPHSPQADVLAGTGALGVPDTKGAHTGVGCIDCHMSEGNHMMKVIKPELATDKRKDSCTACHQGSSSESRGVYLEMWQETITKRLDAITADVAVVDAALKANPDALTEGLKTQYTNARANYWMIQKDNSKGAHNFEYAIKILSKVQADMASVKANLK